MVKKGKKSGYRSFTVVRVGKHGSCKTKGNGGRFISAAPQGAAKKAFSEFCRTKRIRGVCTLLVTIRETTTGSRSKEYTYKLNRRKLKDPVVRLEGTDKEYLIEYTTDIKSVKGEIPCKREGQSKGRPMKRTSKKRTSKKRSRESKKSPQKGGTNIIKKIFGVNI